MGCFDGQCSFTRTNICAGEEVLLVYVRNPSRKYAELLYKYPDSFSRGTWDAVSDSSGSANELHVELVKGLIEKSKQEGDLEKVSQLESELADRLTILEEDRNPYVAITGEYNDYGWIYEFPEPEGFDVLGGTHFMVHLDVAKEICGDTDPTTNEGLRKLAVFAMDTRISPFEVTFGHQSYDKYTIEQMLRRNRMSKMILDKQMLHCEEEGREGWNSPLPLGYENS